MDEGAPDGVEHEIVIDLRDVERPRRDEARAVAGLTDLAVLLEDPDLEAGQGQVPCGPTAGRAGTDDQDVIDAVDHGTPPPGLRPAP